MTTTQQPLGCQKPPQALAGQRALCHALSVPNLPQSLSERIRFVFLDRDGVINRKMPEGQWVTSPAQVEMLEGAAAAIAKLNRLGIRVIVVTNQRGIAVGLYSESELFAIHGHLRALLASQDAQLDAIYYCPHDRQGCACRKPKPGMLLQAFDDFPAANASNSLMIGDSLSDVQAGQAAGLPTVFIDGDLSTQAAGASQARALATYCSGSLASFIDDNFDIKESF
jgi:D-glycero-D-manno-heptose 1,7-bisphosphate phosphatase